MEVRGDPDHPVTQGALCAKVNDYERRTYAPDRLLYPLRRSGPKGGEASPGAAGDDGLGAFERVSWDEALETIAGRFRAIVERHGPEALLPHSYMGSMGTMQRHALRRLFHALGASTFHGGICAVSAQALMAEGHPVGFDPEELVHSRLVVLWGINLLTTSPHQWRFIAEARQRHGARVVCIDPRRTRTARAADVHLQIRPGTDAALAAGIGRSLLEEGHVAPSARQALADLDEYASGVAGWTPDRVAAVCGLEETEVTELARQLGSCRPAAIRAGVGPQQSTAGEDFVRAVSALAILGGHWEEPGGGALLLTFPEFHGAAAARPDLQPEPEPRSLDMARLGEALTDSRLEPPIRGLMVWGTNPAVVQPDAGRVRRGLARDDLFTVVVEHFLTDTARYADVVLPSTTQLEHFDIQGAWGHHYISVNHPAIAPRGESRSHGAILRALAEELGLEHEALRESDEEIAACGLPDGVDLETLKARGWVKRSPPRPQPGERGFRELHIAAAVPDLSASATGSQGADSRDHRSPPDALQLLTPKAHYFLNSSFANMPRQRRAMGEPTLQMSPGDAEERGLVDGQPVRVANDRGEVVARLEVTDAVRPGVVALPGKWWDRPGETGAVTNRLTASSWSPAGQPAYNDVFVGVEPAGHPVRSSLSPSG